MRSNNPDLIAGKLKELATIIIDRNDTLKKSRDTGDWEEHMPDAMHSQQQLDNAGKVLYNHFLDALNDFNDKKINKATYSNHLRKYHEFFSLSDLNKIDLPPSLRAEVILREIESHM